MWGLVGDVPATVEHGGQCRFSSSGTFTVKMARAVTRETMAPAGSGEGAPAPDVLALLHPDRLWHHQRVTGASVEVTALRAVAASTGVIP